MILQKAEIDRILNYLSRAQLGILDLDLDLDLQHPRHILIIHIAMRIPTQPNSKLHQIVLAAPDALHKRLRHIRPIQQRAARPDLAIMSPSLGDPIHVRISFAQHLDHRTRRRGRLALEQPGLQRAHEAAADEEHGGGLLVAFLEERGLAGREDVVHFVGAHEGDVQWRAGLEVVLMPVSLCKSHSTVGDAGAHSCFDRSSGGDFGCVPAFRHPVKFDIDGLLAQLV